MNANQSSCQRTKGMSSALMLEMKPRPSSGHWLHFILCFQAFYLPSSSNLHWVWKKEEKNPTQLNWTQKPGKEVNTTFVGEVLSSLVIIRLYCITGLYLFKDGLQARHSGQPQKNKICSSAHIQKQLKSRCECSRECVSPPHEMFGAQALL